MLAGAADELAADRALARRALRVDHVLADGLTRAGEAARADAGEHLLEHDLRQRVTVGEVRVCAHLDLTAAVRRAHPRALHRHAPAAERHAAVLMAVTDRDTLGVVAALRTDDVLDLLGHQLRQHPEPDTDAQRQQPFLRRAGKLAERQLHAFGQRVELPIADLVGSFVYVPHGGSPVLVTCSHSSRSQRDRTRREDRHLKFYELRDNLDCDRLENREKDQTWDDGVQNAKRVLVSGAVCPRALKSVSSAHCLADPPLSEA